MAGFELSSARGGANIWKVLESAGFTGETAMRDFRAEMTNRGIPNDIGQKNSKALTELNKMAKIKYTPLPDELLKLEKEMGIDKSGKFSLSKKLDDVQKWAHKTFGKKTTMPKLVGILNKLDDIPEIAKKGTKYLSKLGFRMIAPLTGIGYATDILNLTDIMGFKDKGIEPRAKVASQTERFRGGGMMDIDTMTQPLGYRTGGSIGTYELTKEDVDLLGMDPSIIESGENIISKDSDEYIKLMEIKPVGVIKGLAQDLFGGLGQLFGGRGAEGSDLPPEIELELLDNQLRALQGLPGSTLLPSNQDQIKKLEDRIQEIKIDLYKSGQ